MTDDTFIDAKPSFSDRTNVTARAPTQTGAVSEMFCDAVDRLTSVVDDARRPGRPLDTLARITRDAPLGALFVAFLAGVAISRRRRR